VPVREYLALIVNCHSDQWNKTWLYAPCDVTFASSG